MTSFRVLHVDDDPDIREVVEMSLRLESDFEIQSCSTGVGALAVAADWAPSIILLDVMMPEMDGPTTLVNLRKSDKTLAIPVVFMTARAQTRELNHLHSLGAVGVIPKPFDPMILGGIVRNYLQPRDDVPHKLRDIFLQRVDDDAVILGRLKSIMGDGHPLQNTLIEIRSLAHGLAGAGGIYGFSKISEAADSLEEAIVLKLDGSGSVQEITTALNGLLLNIESNKNTYRGGLPVQ